MAPTRLRYLLMTTALTDAELLAKLVAFDSTSHKSNVPIATYIAQYLETGGIEIVRNFNAEQSKVNIIARVVGTEKNIVSQGLILSGHLDVVPATENEWESDPFELHETSDAYIGRGACDMKGFVALAINTARQAAHQRLCYPLVLMLTFDEELGLLGAQHLANTWPEPFPLPKSAIVGEPTSLRVVRAHKGCMYINIHVTGQSAHSAQPHLGANAIIPAARIVTELDILRRRWATQPIELGELFPETPYLTLDVARIQGGSANNIIPGYCQITVGLRSLPEQDRDALIAEIESAMRRGQAKTPNIDCKLEVIANSPPLLVSADSVICQTMCDLMSQKSAAGVSYATDAAILQTMGIDPIIWGPGSIDVAHKPNEFMPKNEFAQARRILDMAVERFCTQ